MKNISNIRSPHFTTNLPSRGRFKMGEHVRLRKLDRVGHPALKRYGANELGTVIGMNYKKGNYMRCYPYYVQFGDGYVFPIKPCYLEQKDTVAAKKRQEVRNKRRMLRRTFELAIYEVLKAHDTCMMMSDYKITDKAIKKIRAIFE